LYYQHKFRNSTNKDGGKRSQKEVKKGQGGGKQVYKKKGLGGAKLGQKQQSSNSDDYFDKYCFYVGKEGPEMYMRTIK